MSPATAWAAVVPGDVLVRVVAVPVGDDGAGCPSSASLSPSAPTSASKSS